MNRLAIFDCDGTLVDSGANICRAMEECFARVALSAPARERTRAIVGLSLLEAMQAMHPEGERHVHDAMVDHFTHAFQQLRARGLVEEPLYKGVAELIDVLDEGDWLLGVATGKSDRGLSLCLEGHGLTRRFVTLQTADRHPSKPHPSMVEAAMAEAGAAPETTVMIGDTSYDMAMARSAGVTAIGVDWGYHPPQELLAAGAHYVVSRPTEIAELLSRHA